MQAALALPILVVPARAGAAEVGEVGIAVLGYKERGLIKVTEPIIWAKGRFAEVWEVSGSVAVDIVSGASPQLVSNATGQPMQTITGASVTDRRKIWDAKVSRRFDDTTLAASRNVSREEDYLSHAFGIEVRHDFNQRNTTLVAGYGRSNDRIRSSDDPLLDEGRDTREYMVGLVQVLSPVAVVQSTLVATRGEGWYNDPYKQTLTFYPSGSPPFAFSGDLRPSSRDTVAWLTRYRRHFPGSAGTLHADYRYFHDDWGIRAHTLEVGWVQSFGARWSLRPALRYYTQTAADFYSPLVPRPQPALISSDQRLAAFGGLSPSLKATLRLESGTTFEATAGYVYNSRSMRVGGEGSPAFQPLRAYYGVVSIVHEF
ncbi:MAG TPA: DUF3570 domain-containing protein [Usitatibacter sp.]|nr:DUF3570 domain-containing protein [Usitatibacter sp.]